MTTAVYMQVNRYFPSEIIQRSAIQQLLNESKILPSSVQWFIDRESKSDFEQLMTDIKNGSIQTVILYSLEQAFPSIASITDAFKWFSSKNMGFASVSQNIYFDQKSIRPATALLSSVLGLADHYQRMRQSEGIAKAKAKGLYRGKKPGSLKPGVDIKKVLRLRERGYNAKRIAKKLGLSESTVYRYFRISPKKE